MKRIIKGFGSFIIYVIVGIIVTLIISSFTKSEEIYICWFKLIMGIFSLCVILFSIWRYLKSKYAKKKFFIYTSVFLVEIILIQVLSYTFNISTKNTWLSVIGMDIIFLTIDVLLFDIAKSIKNTRESIVFSLYFAIFFLFLIMVIINIVFFILIGA